MVRQKSLPKDVARSKGREQGWQAPAVCLALAAITIAVFGQTLAHDFVDYDDNGDVFENLVVSQGLTLKGLVWAFSFHSSNWFPMTWLSHMLDCQLYGLHPGGHHLTNVLLHSATVVALFLVLRQMTGAFWRSAFVAAVFAIHPLRVESVAWVAERKDVLSGFFFILTIGAYTQYARRPWSPARYGLVMLLFALGLMCKPMVVTLPVVLLLLDYWPLQRTKTRKLSGLVLEKLPLLALSAAGCVVTLVAQHEGIQSVGSFSSPIRLANALVTCVIYLGQMVWPVGLAVFYPYPHNGLPAWEAGLAGMLLASISVAVLCQRRKQPWLLVGWLWYLVMLLPVVGIIQVGNQAHADRYTYLPQIGIYLAVTWLVAKLRVSRVAFGCLMAGVPAILMVCAWNQTAYWKNSETLWTHALACTKGNYVAQVNLGHALMQEGRIDEALTHFQDSLEIKPDHAEALCNIASALLQKGRMDEAITQYQAALQINPGYEEAHYNLGDALLQKGNLDEAIYHLRCALQTNPDNAQAHDSLGIALLHEGKVEEAAGQFQNALRINPGYPQAHYNLGALLCKKGNVDEAITQYEEALRLKPDFAATHYSLGNALSQKGRVDEAIFHYKKALEIMPDNASFHVSLAVAFLQKGETDQAIFHFQSALQLQPADATIQNNLAWLLATSPEASLRNGNKAMELARQANASTGGENPAILHTLAAACAEAGRFSEAMETAQRALSLAGAQSNTRLASQLQYEINLYQAGSPFHITEKHDN